MSALLGAGVVLVGAGILRRLQLGSWPRLLAAVGDVDRGAPAWLARRWAAAALPGDEAHWWRAWRASTVLLVLASFVFGSSAAALVVGASVTVAPLLVLYLRRECADVAVAADVPVLLEAVARSVRSGATVVAAVGDARQAIAGPLAGDLDRVLAEVGAGVPLGAALERWPSERSLAAVRLAATTVAVAAEAGGPAARVLDSVAAGLRSDAAAAAEGRALAAQARLSAWVIGLAPIGFGVLAGSTDPRTASFLLGTTTGLLCLTIGLALDVVAVVWMHRITAGVT